MHAVYLGIAILCIASAVFLVGAAVSLIIYASSLALRNEEVAKAVNLDTQYKAHRYNSILGAVLTNEHKPAPKQSPKGKGTNLVPFRRDGKDGDRRGDSDNS